MPERKGARADAWLARPVRLTPLDEEHHHQTPAAHIATNAKITPLDAGLAENTARRARGHADVRGGAGFFFRDRVGTGTPMSDHRPASAAQA